MKKLSTKIRISELADVSARLVALFKGEKSLAEDVFLKPLFAQIEEKSVALSVAIKKESVISKLDELDGLRDDTIRDLRSALAGYASLRTAEIKESAEQLLAIFDRYGLKIVKENFSEESGHIESMLRDFSEAPAKALVEKLGGIKEILQELQERQSAFNTERVAYEKTLSVQGAAASASVLKKPLLELLNAKLLSFLTAMKEQENYRGFAAGVARFIDEMNETIARRGKK